MGKQNGDATYFSLIIYTVMLCLETIYVPLPWISLLQLLAYSTEFFIYWTLPSVLLGSKALPVYEEGWGYSWSCVVVVHFYHWVRLGMGNQSFCHQGLMSLWSLMALYHHPPITLAPT